jgi:radical SAM protein with 4Fe4S-binding SPASM domain
VALVKQLNQLDCRLEIISNGVLLRGEIAQVLYDADLQILNISFDGARKETYEKIRARARYDEVLENVAGMRNSLVGSDTFFAVNFTAMRSNMNEIGEALNLWEKLGIDQLRVLGMVVREPAQSLLDECIYPVLTDFYQILDNAARQVVENGMKLALYSSHFYRLTSLKQKIGNHLVGSTICSDNPKTRVVPRVRQALQITEGHDESVKCFSPFTFARVLFNGDVQLCYRFSVGNLRDATFGQIWHGEKANAIRQKIQQDDSVCKTCGYFRFCLKSDRVNYDQLGNHFSEELLPNVNVLPNGSLELKQVPLLRQPRLVGSVGKLNIVEFLGKYFVIPQSLGPMDLASTDLSETEGVFVTTDYRRARDIAHAISSGKSPPHFQPDSGKSLENVSR